MTVMSEELLDTIRADGETEASEGATAAEIMSVQQALGVQLPPGYIQFLTHFNGGNFREVRIHSINEIAGALAQARSYVPAVAEGHMLPFGSSWAGDLFCFNLSEQAEDGECPVVLWNHEYPEESDDEPYLWEPQTTNFADFLAAIYTD